MDSLLANFDIDKPQNFWKLYPSWKTPKALKALHDADKSQQKTKSSQIMWAIIHMFDRTENNPYGTMDSDERIDVINDDILDDTKYNWKDKQDIIDAVKMLMTTELERNRDNLILYLEKRRKFIEDEQEQLDFDVIANIDKAIKGNKELLVELDRLNAAINLTEDDGVTKGGKRESLNETGLLRQ